MSFVEGYGDTDLGPGGAPPSAPAPFTASRDDAKDIGQGLADIQRRKMASAEKEYTDFSAGVSRDQGRVEKAYESVGAEAQNLKPWNYEHEAAKRRTDPIEAFGSFASAFALIASAFTGAPLENALNASAAAMNAIREGNDKDYDRAYKSWEANTKQAVERHKMQHQAYQDAVSLMTTNMSAAKVKLQLAAARFDDQKVLFLLENGMDKDLIDTMAARQKLALSLEQEMPRIVEANAEMGRLLGLGYDPKNPSSPKSQEAYVKFKEEQARLKASERGGSAATSLTSSRQIAADVAKARDQWRAEGLSEDEIARRAADLTRELQTRSAAPSGNRIDQLKGLYQRAGYMVDTIGKIEGLLAKHRALTGVGGAVTRPMEVVSNWFGSNETDRAQFRRYVTELHEWGTRVLNESAGRPLSAEMQKLQAILPGLAPGDTTANVVRAYRELKPLLGQIQNQLNERITGQPWQGGAGGSGAAPARAPSWRNAPLVQ